MPQSSDFEFILASASPRRRALLSELGLSFSVFSPEVDESPLPGEEPADLCGRLARLKAEAYRGGGRALVLGADTVVVVPDGGERVLGKPRDARENLDMLRLLQGRSHIVLTGVALRWDGRTALGVERTEVRFRPLDEAAMAAYVSTGEGLDKAGGYAVQGRGALMVERLDGDYFNVVGLPLCRVGTMMETLGFTPSDIWRGLKCV